MTHFLHKRPVFWSVACFALISASAGAAGGGFSGNDPAPAHFPRKTGDISILTYNVKALPWPLAGDRSTSLRRMGDRLALMRKSGRQPDVVVLQEAFLDEAKAIGRLGGYRYQVLGAGPDGAATGRSQRIARHWYLGETQGKKVDSGLVVLSDHPIVQARRLAFAGQDCAGFDCLAAKGALMVEVALPSGIRVAIATTHLNSRSASAARPAEADAAYARQADRLGRFIRDGRRDGIAVILAGDFNRGNRPSRTVPLERALASANNGRQAVSQLDACLNSRSCAFDDRAPARAIAARAHDLQYVLQGPAHAVAPISGTIPFPEPDGLSDHPGFTMSYRIDLPN